MQIIQEPPITKVYSALVARKMARRDAAVAIPLRIFEGRVARWGGGRGATAIRRNEKRRPCFFW